MGNRKLPFGYRIKFGDIIIHHEESECVHLIFDLYQQGASFNDLVDEMKERGVPFDNGKLWNKNMVARILGDERYTGHTLFPTIISKEQFDAVVGMRAAKQVHIDKTEAQKTLRRLCGTKVTPDIERQVLFLLNRIVECPELIYSPSGSSRGRTEIAMLQRKLDEVLMQQPIEEDAARSLIYKLASAEYDSIDSAEHETERIRRLLLEAQPAEELDETLLRKCVKKVQIDASNTVSLQLKNGQMIEGRMLP